MKVNNASNIKNNGKNLAHQRKLTILFDQNKYKNFYINKNKKPSNKRNNEKNIKSIRITTPNKQLKYYPNSSNNSFYNFKNSKISPSNTVYFNKTCSNKNYYKKNNKLRSADSRNNQGPYQNIYSDDGGFTKKLSSNIYHNNSETNNNINIIYLSKKEIKNLLGDDYLNKFINKGADLNRSKISNGRFKVLRNKNPIVNYRNFINNTNGNNENNNICKVTEKYGGDFSDDIFKNSCEEINKNNRPSNGNEIMCEKNSDLQNTNKIKNDTNNNDNKQSYNIDNCINIFIEGIKIKDKNYDENYKKKITKNYSSDHLDSINNDNNNNDNNNNDNNNNDKNVIYLKKQPCITFVIKNETNRKFNTIEKGDNIIMSYYPDKSKQNNNINKSAVNDYFIISDHIEYIINIKKDFEKDKNIETEKNQDKESNKEDENDNNNKNLQQLNNYIICSNLNDIEYINLKIKEKPYDICSNLLEFEIPGIQKIEENIMKEHGPKEYNICSCQIEYIIPKTDKENKEIIKDNEKHKQYDICSIQVEYLIPKIEKINNISICPTQIELTINSFKKIPNFMICSNQIEYKICKLNEPKEELKNPDISNNPISLSKIENNPNEITTNINEPTLNSKNEEFKRVKSIKFIENNSKELNDITQNNNNINQNDNITAMQDEKKKENDDKLPELNNETEKKTELNKNDEPLDNYESRERRTNKRFLSFRKKVKKMEEKEEQKGSSKKVNKINIFAKLLQDKLSFGQNNEKAEIEQKPEISVESDVNSLIEKKPLMGPKRKKAKILFNEE